MSQDTVTEFKLDNTKINVSDFSLSTKHVRKINAKQKVNNILIVCESYERYVVNNNTEQLSELTFWVEIKVFGNHKYRPAYNYELHANLNSKYNQIYDTTTQIRSIKVGNSDYQTLERFLGFVPKGFDKYIADFVNLVVAMNKGKELTGTPKFIIEIADTAQNYQNAEQKSK